VGAASSREYRSGTVLLSFIAAGKDFVAQAEIMAEINHFKSGN
jgi:hypothetical protein